MNDIAANRYIIVSDRTGSVSCETQDALALDSTRSQSAKVRHSAPLLLPKASNLQRRCVRTAVSFVRKKLELNTERPHRGAVESLAVCSAPDPRPSHAQIFFRARRISRRHATATFEFHSYFQHALSRRSPRPRICFHPPGGASNLWGFSIGTGGLCACVSPQNSGGIIFFHGHSVVRLRSHVGEGSRHPSSEKTSRNSGWGGGRSNLRKDMR